MINGTTTYEIPAVPGAEATLNRIVIVPDLSVFDVGDGFLLNWTAEGIDAVIRWCDLRDASMWYPHIIVLSANHTYNQYMFRFAGTWTTWMRELSRHNGIRIKHERGEARADKSSKFGGDLGRVLSAKFFPAEFLSDFTNHGINPWWHVVEASCYMLHRVGWWHRQGEVSITETLARGKLVILTEHLSVPETVLPQEIVVLDRANDTGEVTARAFRIRRVTRSDLIDEEERGIMD